MPDVPEGAKIPQDHAAKTEARSQFIEFDYDERHYKVDRENANNIELFEFVEDEQYTKALRGFLGLDQWKQWKDSVRDSKGRVPSEQFEPFLQAVMDAIGGSKGNSSASPGS